MYFLYVYYFLFVYLSIYLSFFFLGGGGAVGGGITCKHTYSENIATSTLRIISIWVNTLLSGQCYQYKSCTGQYQDDRSHSL